MSKLTNITIVTDAGGTETLTIQNYAETDELQYWGSTFDQALDGTLRSNFRDSRKMVELSYNLCTDAPTYTSICNNIATDFINGSNFVYIGIDTGSLFRVVLDDDFVSRVQYANQHGLFVPKITLKAFELGVVITLNVEDWRFVDDPFGIEEQRDYGLIDPSDPVTEPILDYGSI
jgi:hypothetical protein